MSHNYHFFSVVRTYRIYSLSNFQVYDTELLTLITMPNIRSPELIHLTTGSLGPLFEQYPFTQQNVLLSCGLGVNFAEKSSSVTTGIPRRLYSVITSCARPSTRQFKFRGVSQLPQAVYKVTYPLSLSSPPLLPQDITTGPQPHLTSASSLNWSHDQFVIILHVPLGILKNWVPSYIFRLTSKILHYQFFFHYQL